MLIRNISNRVLRCIRPQWKRLVRHHNTDGDNTFRPMSIQMLSQEDDANIYIEAYSPVGFKLNSGFRILGPCAVFPRSVLHWNVRNSEDISEQSLSLFCVLEPKIDILILGIGDHGSKFDIGIIKYLKSKKINVEILPTDQACSTFNFLNSERRYVAAALIPPKEMFMDIDETFIFEENEMDYTSLPDLPGEFEEEYKYIEENLYGIVKGKGLKKPEHSETKNSDKTDNSDGTEKQEKDNSDGTEKHEKEKSR